MKAIIPIILFGLTLIGCSPVSVSTDYNPEINFEQFKSFSVFKGEVKGSELEKAPLIKARVISSVEKTMTSKGFVLDESGKADLVIYPFAGTKDKMNVTDWGYGYGGYWGRYPYGRDIDVSYYTEASLVLDFVDGKKGELAWRGIGTGAIQQDKTTDERQATIDEAVSQILAEYPPGSDE